jgi:hypothetical protein
MKKNVSISKQLLTASVFLLLFGCRKGIIENQTDPLLSTGKQGSTLTTLNVTDVYVAGTLGGNQAVYWQNGTLVTLPGGTVATGIDVVGTDVYVSGTGINPSTGASAALYWKNGVLTTLPTGGTTDDVWTTGIAVSGTGEVYISGYTGRFATTAVYWKDGVLKALASSGSGGITGPVFVATNGDVYIPNRNASPSYWLNGALKTLPSPTPASLPHVNAVKEIGGIVYAIGANGAGPWETALYWRSGSLQYMMAPYTFNEATDVAVSATGETYISGTGGQEWGNQQAGYWNGLGDFNKWGTYSFSGYARIAVDGSDIYICGGESNYPAFLSKAMYWHNGTPVYLTNGSSNSYALDITLGQ